MYKVGPTAENSALTLTIMKIKVLIFLDELDHSVHRYNFLGKQYINLQKSYGNKVDPPTPITGNSITFNVFFLKPSLRD